MTAYLLVIYYESKRILLLIYSYFNLKDSLKTQNKAACICIGTNHHIAKYWDNLMYLNQNLKPFLPASSFLLFPQRPFPCFLSQNIANTFLWQSSPLPCAWVSPTTRCSADWTLRPAAISCLMIYTGNNKRWQKDGEVAVFIFSHKHRGSKCHYPSNQQRFVLLPFISHDHTGVLL